MQAQVEKKREWWPIGIVTAMLVFMGGILFAVSIMVKNDVALTSDDYYAKEISYQSEIDKSSRALAAGETPVVEMVHGANGVAITFPGYPKSQSFEGKASFMRPSDPTKDFVEPLRPDSTGRVVVNLQARPAGLWRLELEWTQDHTTFYHEQSVIH